jgi:meso-butanediol dehydrogenase / (S,S)-butanediol dehydrogenase / diacetyl reductase
MGEPVATRLAGKVALISGGGTGIGAATARRFAREGASVVVTGRRPAPIEAVAAEIGGAAVPGDTSDPAHAAEAVDAAVRTFGGLDIVVSNAGIGLGGSAAEVTDEQWTTTIDINLTGPLFLIRAALPRLIDRGGGSIVVVSSVSGIVSDNDSAAYVTSKAGLLGLVRSVAVDYGSLGIRANAVLPGWVHTPMGDESMEELAARDGLSLEEAYAAATADSPLRRAGQPEEIAACCAFLASDESSFVTGASLVADGGATVVDVAGLAFDPRRWEPTR